MKEINVLTEILRVCGDELLKEEHATCNLLYNRASGGVQEKSGCR